MTSRVVFLASLQANGNKGLVKIAYACINSIAGLDFAEVIANDRNPFLHLEEGGYVVYADFSNFKMPGRPPRSYRLNGDTKNSIGVAQSSVVNVHFPPIGGTAMTCDDAAAAIAKIFDHARRNAEDGVTYEDLTIYDWAERVPDD